ncbi:hypothetical protein An01g13970 [Aspergillus niger]|uniref:Uncharacterized protein n=2 Tax=Aspergillus niger TaxID=5061 RepID=A2QB57_ASPNC|nr:hypothetical protein An01g13970 [Aspergillus niger]CAK37401.1 hypothetical protein An01g13970 [Aspergillus niger]
MTYSADSPLHKATLPVCLREDASPARRYAVPVQFKENQNNMP